MKRSFRVLLAVGVSFFVLQVAPVASADSGSSLASADSSSLDPCPEQTVVQRPCPPPFPSGNIFVCRDHHGIITVHHHCNIFTPNS